MSAIKVTLPPAEASSQLFSDALKICIAQQIYQAPIELTTGEGTATVLLSIAKENRSLHQANAIVRYLATSTGSTITPGQASLIEYEETFLAVHSQNAPDATFFESLSSVLATANLDPTIMTAAHIILFSALYRFINKATALHREKHAMLYAWFDAILRREEVMKGVEQAAELTAGQTLGKKSKKAKTVAPTVARTVSASDRKIKPGIEIKALSQKEVLPVDGERNILITSALPYVNNVPHLGNIIGSVLSADVFARYSKARNINTLFVCGTDEYGTATETKALEEGCTPQELCDKFHKIHSDVYKWFEIGFDHFGRTTTSKQTEIAQDIFLSLKERDYLVEKSTTQLYDETHGKFLADRYVEGICPICAYEDARGDQCDGCGNLLNPLELKEPRSKLGGKVVVRDSNHIFLSLDKLQPAVEAWSKESSQKGQWSSNGIGITNSWLKKGLTDRCITRDLKWGTPVPMDSMREKVLYVWFDATIGYISITANYTDSWQKWWRNPDNVQLYQFMGKDNVPFHTVVFPASLIGTGEKWTMLHHINTTEYLQYEGGKFSKSRNVGVFGNNAQDTGIPPSVWRYYLLASRPESADTMFAWSDFIAKNNAELLANFGNFVNRVIKFVNAKYHGIVPAFEPEKDVGLVQHDGFIIDVNKFLAQYIDLLDHVKERAALAVLMQLSSRGNQFLQDNKIDNALFTNEPEKCAAVVGLALNLIYLLASLAWPYMPSTAESMVEQLNVPLARIPDKWTFDLLPGHVIGLPAYLFTRIDEAKEAQWKQQFGGGSNM